MALSISAVPKFDQVLHQIPIFLHEVPLIAQERHNFRLGGLQGKPTVFRAHHWRKHLAGTVKNFLLPKVNFLEGLIAALTLQWLVLAEFDISQLKLLLALRQLHPDLLMGKGRQIVFKNVANFTFKRRRVFPICLILKQRHLTIYWHCLDFLKLKKSA